MTKKKDFSEPKDVTFTFTPISGSPEFVPADPNALHEPLYEYSGLMLVQMEDGSMAVGRFRRFTRDYDHRNVIAKKGDILFSTVDDDFVADDRSPIVGFAAIPGTVEEPAEEETAD